MFFLLNYTTLHEIKHIQYFYFCSEVSFGERMLLGCTPFVELLFVLVSQIPIMCKCLHIQG